MTSTPDMPPTDHTANAQPTGSVVGPNGAWLIDDPDTTEHRFDPELCKALRGLVTHYRIPSVVDLGCGLGHYQRALAAETDVCHGFDGNPHTPWLTQGRCGMLDLSVPVQLPRRYHLVLSLEVGEHIPAAFEGIFLDNVTRHSCGWVVLSWAVEGQGGLGHVNERSNAYVQERMGERDFVLHARNTEALRAAATLPWFKNTVMVFQHVRLTPEKE